MESKKIGLTSHKDFCDGIYKIILNKKASNQTFNLTYEVLNLC